jgi:hypothetical protein
MTENAIINASKEQHRFYEAVKQLAKAIGCDTSNEGGKEFARIMLPAISEAAYLGGDVLKGIAIRLLAFRPQRKAASTSK